MNLYSIVNVTMGNSPTAPGTQGVTRHLAGPGQHIQGLTEQRGATGTIWYTAFIEI